MRLLGPMLLLGALAASPAHAQAAWSASEFERGFGMDASSWDQPIEVATDRDANGNRLFVNGRSMADTTLIGGLTDGGGGSSLGASAVGNQLTVVTQGNWNTVIIDSTQINNGDISAVAEGAQ